MACQRLALYLGAATIPDVVEHIAVLIIRKGDVHHGIFLAAVKATIAVWSSSCR